jgi:flavin-dependent dehydrogenase
MLEQVVDCVETPDSVRVRTDQNEYQARFVIIAEGSLGRLKYRVRPKDRTDEYAISIVADIPADNADIDKYIFNAIDIHFGMTHRGYGWIFPHNGYFSASIGGLARDLKMPRKLMADFLKANEFNGEYKLRSHIVPLGGIRRNTVTSRIILAGDAAGYVDPFYGEGIAYAIRSGQIAIDVIHKIMADKAGLGLLLEYGQRCDQEFGNNLKYSLMLSKLMHRFPRVFFRALTRHHEVLREYLEVPALNRTYKSYIRWLGRRIPKYLLG